MSLTWGANQSSGACSTAASSGCWTDANLDGVVQMNELSGTPTLEQLPLRQNGVLLPAGNIVDPSAQDRPHA